MWSNQYWYYNIRSDEIYSDSLSSNKVVGLLENIDILKKKGPQVFINSESFPWIKITCVCSNNGSFAHDDSDKTDRINLITIVASKQHPENEQKYIELLKAIADKLKWELVIEEDDDGDQDIKLN
jgi:hypothetical protein